MNKEVWSKCCLSSVRVYSGEEGTNHYICNACNEVCDVTDRQTSAQSNKGDTNDIDELHQILDDFYDGVFIEELPKAKTKLENLIAQETNKAALNELEDFNKAIVIGSDRVEHYLRRREALTADKESKE